MAINIEVRAKADESRYEVVVGDGAAAGLGSFLAGKSYSRRATVVSNPDVWAFTGGSVDESLAKAGIRFDLIEIPEGEAFKTPETCRGVYDALAGFGAVRSDPIIAVGGGVIGDLAGFVAATYMRGVPFVNVPTTLLAMVDSSVGGKTGVDLPAGKNLVGAFYQPEAVFSDVSFLGTLPDAEIKSGLVEIIKSSLLAGGEFYGFMKVRAEELKERDEQALEEAVVKSVRFKAEKVSGDIRDLTGKRAVLNYGHTYGHALENAAGYRGITHGEAVARGLVFAAKMSENIGVGRKGLVRATEELMAAAGVQPEGPAANPERILEAMRMDKKKTDDRIAFILLKDIGQPVIERVAQDDALALIKEINQ